jgi:hypothetical protein
MYRPYGVRVLRDNKSLLNKKFPVWRLLLRVDAVEKHNKRCSRANTVTNNFEGNTKLKVNVMKLLKMML